MTDKMRVSTLGFEIETCSRCGGSGNYSYCQSYGTTCFKCRGKKVTLTKRGEAASRLYAESLKVPATDIVVGDVIRCESVTNMGDSFGYWGKVESITPYHMKGKSMRDNVWTEYDYMTISINTAHDKFGKCGYVQSPGSTIRRWMTGEQKAPFLKAALAYQDKLTKLGTVRKGK